MNEIMHMKNLGYGTNLAGLRLDMVMPLFLPTLGSFCCDFLRGGVHALERGEHYTGLFRMKEKRVRPKPQIK